MNLSQRIQAKTDNGDLIIDFLTEVMTDELDDFQLYHRLQAARLLTKYGCNCRGPALAQRDEGIAFILENPPEPSQAWTASSSSDDSEFDMALSKKIRESTDDGATVCRFLINVMDGELKVFKPHHRISAARELLDRGFGKHARQTPPPPAGEGWSLPRTRYGGEGDNQEHQPTTTHVPQPSTQPTESQKSPNQTNQSSDNTPYSDTGSDCCEDDETPWDEINEIIDAGIERSNRIMAEQGIDPDNPPHVPDYSAFDEAMENSHRWFHEWKNSIDPEEYQTIIKETAERFDAKIDLRIERRKQIKADRERREKEEADREAEQAKARAEAKTKAEAEAKEAKEAEDLGPPPSRQDHETWSPTPSIPTSFRLVNCGHPKCKLHDGPIYYPEDDRSSPYYFDGRPPTMYPRYPL